MLQIRKRIINIPKNFGTLFLGTMQLFLVGSILPNSTCFAQSPVLLEFIKERISLTNVRSFYILDVIDKRGKKPTYLGDIYVFGQPKPLQTSQNLNRVLFDHWTFSLRARDEDALPLEIVLEDVSVAERKIAPNKIAGEIKVKVSFQWTRSAKPLFLTNYSAATTYTRPETQYDYEPFLRKMLDGSLKHFDQWLGLNDERNPLLARDVKIVFKESIYKDSEDTVFYKPERKLNWNDFRGNNNRPGSKFAAAVFSSMSYEGNSRMAGKHLQVSIDIKVFMVKSMSWGKPEARNAYTLSHEQTHFDITRIVAERFKEKLKKMNLTIEDYDSQIQYEFLETFREMNTEQEKYDGDSRHGINTQVQTEWTNRISSEIVKIYRDS